MSKYTREEIKHMKYKEELTGMEYDTLSLVLSKRDIATINRLAHVNNTNVSDLVSDMIHGMAAVHDMALDMGKHPS